jgi:hypothetical protein
MRGVVEAVAHAGRGIDGVAVLAGEHQRRDARDLRLVGEHLQIEHQLEMRLEVRGMPTGAFGRSRSRDKRRIDLA